MNSPEDKNIPVFKKWSYWYIAVIIFESLLILAFYFITNSFS
ncbi:MAG: hypothetical protein ABI687_06380 [Flavitalea sp.]